MGNTNSKKKKLNKNHVTKKGFQFGLSFGRGDMTMEGNVQIGWTNKTIKNYTCVEEVKICLKDVEDVEKIVEEEVGKKEEIKDENVPKIKEVEIEEEGVEGGEEGGQKEVDPKRGLDL